MKVASPAFFNAIFMSVSQRFSIRFLLKKMSYIFLKKFHKFNFFFKHSELFWSLLRRGYKLLSGTDPSFEYEQSPLPLEYCIMKSYPSPLNTALDLHAILLQSQTLSYICGKEVKSAERKVGRPQTRKG